MKILRSQTGQAGIIGYALALSLWAATPVAAQSDDPALAALTDALSSIDRQAYPHAIAQLEHAVADGHLLLGSGPDLALAARLLLAQLHARQNQPEQAAAYGGEAHAIAQLGAAVAPDLARAAQPGGVDLPLVALAARARDLIGRRDPAPAGTDGPSLDERASLHASISVLEGLAWLRPIEGNIALRKAAVAHLATRIGPAEQYTLEVAMRLVQVIAGNRQASAEELAALRALLETARDRYGDWNELTQGFRYYLIQELAKRGQRDVFLELDLARLQLSIDTGIYARPYAPDDEDGRFRAGQVARDAYAVRRLALEALESDDAALAPAGRTRSDLVRIAFHAAQLELLGPISLAARAADLRAATRASGMFYTHNWDGQMSRLAGEWKALRDFDSQNGAGLTRQAVENLLTTRAFVDVGEAKVAAAVPDYRDILAPPAIDAGSGDKPYPEIDTDAALILIAAGPDEPDGEPAIFVLTDEGVAQARLPWSRERFASAIANYRDGIRGIGIGAGQVALRAPVSPPVARAARPVDLTLGNDIFSAIFGDPSIATHLDGRSSWIIAAQDPFLSLPFAALPMSPPTGGLQSAKALRETPWLGIHRNIAYVGALDDAAGPTRQTETGPTSGYVGFGNPAFAGPTGSLRATSYAALANEASRVVGVASLPGLPATQAEVLATGALFSPDRRAIRLGERASEAELLALSASGALRGISVLHFATHGILGDGRPGDPGASLALSPPDTVTDIAPGFRADGLLTIPEIGLLQLDADWVLLSACDTAAGERSGGESLTGLARSFLSAGARNILATQWAVEDAATQRLVAGTLSRMTGNATAAKALRQSILALIEDRSRDDTALPLSHPYVWAPFMVFSAS